MNIITPILLMALISKYSSANACNESPATTNEKEIFQDTDESTIVKLKKIESAGKTLQNLFSKISYFKYDKFLDRIEIRTGALGYAKKKTSPTISISFDTLVIGNKRIKQNKKWIFESNTSIEKNYNEKLLIKRDMGPPEEKMNIFDLNGKFPLPIGQPTKDVIKLFNITTQELPKHKQVSKILKNYSNTIPIKLVPKNKNISKWKTIVIYYSSTTWMPHLVHGTSFNNNESIIHLENIDTNVSPDDTQLELFNKSAPGADWHEEYHPWNQNTQSTKKVE